MRPWIVRTSLFFAFFLSVSTAILAFAAPSITSLTPSTGAIGSSVTIAGSGFGSTQGTSTVKFNGTTATTISSWGATSIVAVVPTGATTGNVVVTVSGTASAGKLFTVAPGITTLSPSTGAIVSSVTITGTSFGSTQGSSTVKFNGTTATTISSWSATSIVAVVPAGATTGNVVVTVGGIASAGKTFTVAPGITTLSPSTGAIGSSVTITGTSFGSTQGSSTVKFNGTTATTISSWGATSIVAVVPVGATAGNVVVTVGGVASAGKTFTVAPGITTLSPSTGAIGSSVTITGTSFGSTQGSSTVKFNGTTATTISSWSATSIVAVVPAGATTGNVVVTVGGIASAGKAFTVAPGIVSFSPTSAAVGASITITGTSFGATQGTSTVKFNGTTATTFSSWTDTSIGVTVPAGATTGNVVVTVSNVASAGMNFTVVATPNISSLSPTSGAVGTLVTVNGTNFQPSQGMGSITFNGIAAMPTNWTATQIKATVPTGVAVGTATVVVTNTGLSSTGKTFTVKATPVLSSLSQTVGAVGMSITITGSNFGTTQGTVKFNGTTATTITSWATDTIVLPVPSGATTGPVVVHTSGVDTNGINFTVSTLNTISLNPQTISLPLKSVQRFAAMGTYANGTVQNVGGNTTWSSLNASVATTADSSGLIRAVGQGQTTIQAVFGSVSASANLTVTGPTFIQVGNPIQTRFSHTATLLPNGKVLIVGGEHCQNGCDAIASAELYDPATQTFSATGSLQTARMEHTATLLANGKVLIAGGMYFTANGPGTLASAELYDPATGTFTYTGSMVQQAAGNAAIALNDGKVLMLGGSYLIIGGGGGPSAPQIYDPATGLFSSTTGSLNTVNRFSPTLTLLNDGTVLVTGGSDNTAEIYDPTNGTFAYTGSLNKTRSGTATLLTNNNVLMAGGYNCSSDCAPAGPQAEIYDSVAKTFSLIGSPSVPRNSHTATLLNDGTVLLVAGENQYGSAELFIPSNQTFIAAGALSVPRNQQTATLLNDGRVLIVGGTDIHGVELTTAELYSPTIPAPYALLVTPSTASMQVGQSRQFTVVNNLGFPRNDAIWSLSDGNLASITSDPSPVLTALAPGQVTLTAQIQGVSAQAVVTISSPGTITPGTSIWSVPSVPTFVPLQTIQAIPIGPGPDFYSAQLSADGTQTILQSIRADGQQLSQTSLAILNKNSTPDPTGGLIVTQHQTCIPNQTDPMKISDLDPITLQPRWEITATGFWNDAGTSLVYCHPEAPQFAIRPNGEVVIVAVGNTAGLPELMIVDGETGQQHFAPSIPMSTFTDPFGTVKNEYSRIGPPMVDIDGTAYLEYEVHQLAYPPKVVSATLYLLKLPIDNTPWSTSVLSSTTQDQVLAPGRIIPDGQGGLLATWTLMPSNPPQWDPANPPHPYKVSRIIGGAPNPPYDLPFTPKNLVWGKWIIPVLGESGTAFATGPTTSTDGTNTDYSRIAAFDVSSGSPFWTYDSASQLSVISTSAGNGVVAKASTGSSETVIRFTSAGASSSDPWVGTQVDYYINDVWTRLTSDSGFVAYSAPSISFANSDWFQPSQGGSNKAKEIINVKNFSTTGPNQQAIQDVIQKIITALPLPGNATCSTWLQGQGDNAGTSGLQYLQGMIQFTAFGHGSFPLPTAAFTNLGGTTGVPNGISMTVNDDGAFFKDGDGHGTSYSIGPNEYPGGSLRAKAAIIIHEVGHGLTVQGFQPDHSLPKAGKANDNLVNQHCQTLIEGLQ